MSLRLLQIKAVFAAFAFGTGAHAGTLTLTNIDGIEYRQAGNVFTWGPTSAESTRLRGGTAFRGDSVISDVEPKMSTSRALAVGKGLPVTATAPISKKAFGKAVVGAIARGAGGPLPLIASVGLPILADYMLNDLGYHKIDQEGGQLRGHRWGEEVIKSDGYIYKMSYQEISWTGYTPESLCKKAAPSIFDKRKESPNWSLLSTRIERESCLIVVQGNNGYVDTWGYSITKHSDPVCPVGSPVVDGVCGKQPTPIIDLEGDLIRRIAEREAWGPRAAGALQAAANAGQPITTDGPVTVSGPSSVPGNTIKSTETVKLLPGTNTVAPSGHTGPTDSGTKTTTSTTDHQVKYDNSQNPGTHSTTTITNITNNITNITNNITNVTTTDKDEVKTEDKPDIKDEPKDDKDDKSECEKNPKSLTCAELDTPPGEVPRDTKTITYAPEDLGLGGGSCPADRQIGEHTFSYAQTCSHLETYGRYLVLALSTITALIIIFGGRADA